MTKQKSTSKQARKFKNNSPKFINEMEFQDSVSKSNNDWKYQ